MIGAVLMGVLKKVPSAEEQAIQTADEDIDLDIEIM
jgi:hypothetical protein